MFHYSVCVFPPSNNVDHYDIGTPFAITDENIFERPVNRLYYKHQKKGLGVSAKLVESNQHTHTHSHRKL